MSVKNLLTFAMALLIVPELRSESKYQYLEDMRLATRSGPPVAI